MNVFAKYYFGFVSDDWPCVAFDKAGATNFQNNALPGDRVVFVGANTPDTDEENRGVLLGIVEAGDRRYQTRDLVDPRHQVAESSGKAAVDRWPDAFAVTRAWRFAGAPRLLDVLGKPLPSKARKYAAELDVSQCALIAGLPFVELDLTLSREAEAEADRIQSCWGGRPTTGPLPSPWTTTVNASFDWSAETYLMRFGQREVWKVGWARDAKSRLCDVNRHVPFESLKEEWSIIDRVRSPDPYKARYLEQSILNAVDPFRSVGERVVCTEAVMMTAWTKALALAGAR